MWGEVATAKPMAQAMLRDTVFTQALSNETEMKIRGVDNSICCPSPKYDVYGQNGKMLAVKGGSWYKFDLYALPANELVGRMEWTSKNGPSRFEVFAINENIKLGHIRTETENAQCCMPNPVVFEEANSSAKLLTFVPNETSWNCGGSYPLGRFENAQTRMYVGELWKSDTTVCLDANSAHYTLRTNTDGALGNERTMALFMSLVTMMRDLTEE